MDFALEGLKLTACADCDYINKVTDLEELDDGGDCDVCLEEFGNSQLAAQLPCCGLVVHAHCVTDAINLNHDLAKQCFKCRREEHGGRKLWIIFRQIFRAYGRYKESVESLTSSAVTLGAAETVVAAQQDDQSDEVAADRPLTTVTSETSVDNTSAMTADAFASRLDHVEEALTQLQYRIERFRREESQTPATSARSSDEISTVTAPALTSQPLDLHTQPTEVDYRHIEDIGDVTSVEVLIGVEAREEEEEQEEFVRS